jgi:predicted RNase H-like HicB family nuclease
MSPFLYPVRFETSEDGRILARFRDFDGASTDGANREEALTEATDLMESVLADTVNAGLVPPSASRPSPGDALIEPSGMTTAQLDIYLSMRAAGMDAHALAAKLGRKPDHVNALIDLRNYPALSDLEAALAVFGKRIAIVDVAAE